MNLRFLTRYASGDGLVYDSEFSITPSRLTKLATTIQESHVDPDFYSTQRLRPTDGTTMGNAYWDQVKAYGEAKVKAKGFMKETPFQGNDGKGIKIVKPTCSEIDSMSMMPFDALEDIYEKGGVDGKEMNIEALRSNLFKNRILMQMPGITSHQGFYCIVVAHMGDDLALDPMAPPAKKLAFLKQKIKFKQVPEKFTFLTNNLFYCHGAQVHMNKTDKTPFFPRDMSDRGVGDTDLQLVNVQNLRAKSGPTGIPWQMVVSQAEGLLPSLTELQYLRKNKVVGANKYPQGFGLTGNDQKYHLDLVPEQTISRTTARGLFDGSERLQRAVEITSELAQMNLLWKDIPENQRITPAELYASLKAKGYDWNLLLDTRGYWIFSDEDHPKPFLSTQDLLNMHTDDYKPYWMPAADKAKIIANAAIGKAMSDSKETAKV